MSLCNSEMQEGDQVKLYVSDQRTKYSVIFVRSVFEGDELSHTIKLLLPLKTMLSEQSCFLVFGADPATL